MLGNARGAEPTQLMDGPSENSDAATPSEASRFLVAGIDILANPHLPVVPESPLKDRREAVLFMHYVHTLSLWARLHWLTSAHTQQQQQQGAR